MVKFFFEVFLSVLPFHTENHLDRRSLTERILVIEYGSVIISSLCGTSKTAITDVTRSLVRREQIK